MVGASAHTSVPARKTPSAHRYETRLPIATSTRLTSTDVTTEASRKTVVLQA